MQQPINSAIPQPPPRTYNVPTPNFNAIGHPRTSYCKLNSPMYAPSAILDFTGI